MNAFNDSLTIGLVFFLIISAVSIYFYTRLQEFENKIEMTEGMLFDIKSTLEFMHYVGSTGEGAPLASSSASAPLASSSASDKKPEAEAKPELKPELEPEEQGKPEAKPETETEAHPLIPLLVPFAEDDDKSVKSELSVSSSTGKPQPDINNILSLRLNELRKLAKAKNIVNYMKLTKKELVEQLSGGNKDTEELDS